ncbi:unnamed protein product [Caenorhabditis brenneri]
MSESPPLPLQAPEPNRERVQDPELNGPFENIHDDRNLGGLFANVDHQPDPPPPNIFPANFFPYAILCVTFDGFREKLQQQTIQLEQIQPIEGLNDNQKHVIKTQLERIKEDLDIYGRVVNETMIKFGVEDGQMEFDEHVVELDMEVEDDEMNAAENRENQRDLNNNSEEEQA